MSLPTQYFRMFDLNSAKVFCAGFLNVPLAVLPWVSNFDSVTRALLTLAQFGVAVATIIYIAFKIRNERRK